MRWRFRIERRSHFDGQAILETGIDKPVGSSDGWLNRLLAGDARAAIRHCHRVGDAPFADRSIRCTDVVADTARRGQRRVSGSVVHAVSHRQGALRPFRGGDAAAGSRRRGTDGRRRRAPRRHYAADAGGSQNSAAGWRTEHRSRRVQRVGHARKSGSRGRRARQAARAARRRTDGVPHRHGSGMVERRRLW